MFFEFVTNFAILFSFTVLIFWPFIRLSKNPLFTKYKSITVGVIFGIVAIILTLLTAPFANGALVNSRSILLIFGGLLGGPVTLLITGFIMGISRFIFMFTSTLSLIMSINIFFVSTIAAFVARKHPISYTNISRYFYVITIEHAIVLLVYYQCSLTGIKNVTIYLVFATISFYAIRKILSTLEDTTTQVRQIYALGKTDFLTQLPNNTAIEQHLHTLIHAKLPFELLHIDLQHFQRINLQHQYQTGDEVLATVGQIIKESVKDGDAFLGRPGSDEFYVILPQAAPAHAITSAHQIAQAIRKCEFSLDKDTVLSVSPAIGICSYPNNAASIDSIYQNAYYALQQAKHQDNIYICHFNQLTHPTD